MRSHFSVDLPTGKAPFNLDFTLDCGQVLRWRRQNGAWRGIVAGAVILLDQGTRGLEVHSTHDWVDAAFLSRYFRWDDDLEAIYRRLAKDAALGPLTRQYPGLRLIRQDAWECLATYVCAIFKNIPAIQRMLDALARRFGEPIPHSAGPDYAFPTPARLAAASLPALRACGTGFRARFLKGLARHVAAGELDLDAIRPLTYEHARARLLAPLAHRKFLGLGPKVVDCLLLFGLEKLEAFPIDVWIMRGIRRSFGALLGAQLRARLVRAVAVGSLPEQVYELVAARMREHFWPYGGYAQQLLYYETRSRRRFFARRSPGMHRHCRATPAEA